MNSSKHDISYAKYLFHQGKGTRCYQFLGARPADGGEGFLFRLWAPNAEAVSVTGDFCGWDDDVAEFCRRMNLIIKDVVLEYGCNYQAIQKPLAANSILRKDFKAWKKYHAPKGDRVFPRQMFIAEKLLKLLSINA